MTSVINKVFGSLFERQRDRGSSEELPEPEPAQLPENQAEFEAEVMELLATLNPKLKDIILQQYAVANVSDRWGSHVGCFTEFEISEGAPTLPTDAKGPLYGPTFSLGGRCGETGMSLLFLKGGKIDCLECVTDGETWPTERYEYEFRKVKVHKS